MKKLSEIVGILNPSEVFGRRDREIESFARDSRKCSKNSLFIAIEGAQFNGRDYISSAATKGATVIVCDKPVPELENSGVCSLIYVDDARAALAKLAHFWNDYPAKDFKMFGVTGTNGKTTVTYLLRSIFEEAGIPAGIIGTTGIIAGEKKVDATHTTPGAEELCDYLRYMKKKEMRAVVMEVSSHSLSQRRVDGVRFEGAAYTNLSREHLDYHADMEDYASQKKILFDSLDEKAVAVFNSDDDFASYIARDTKARKIAVGRNEIADYQIMNEIISSGGSTFELRDNKTNSAIELKIKTPGRFNIDNAAIAAALALSSNIDAECVRAGLAKSKGAPGRMQYVPLKNGAVGIVDYAHTPDALEKALLACRETLIQSGGGSLICVFGCGGDRDREKRPEMGRIAAKIADYVVLTTDNPRGEDPDKIILQIYSGIEKSDKKNAITITHRREAIDYACKLAKSGDIVLLAGKGHETYQIIGERRFYFDDVYELSRHGFD